MESTETKKGENMARKALRRSNSRYKKSRKMPDTLEDMYKKVFVGPIHPIPAKERLSMYKSVPTVTTYGAYDKPA